MHVVFNMLCFFCIINYTTVLTFHVLGGAFGGQNIRLDECKAQAGPLRAVVFLELLSLSDCLTVCCSSC